jgi:DNA topoisomerase IA
VAQRRLALSRARKQAPCVSVCSGEARLKEIASAASGCGRVLLATDPDREGEAISWHLSQELKVIGHQHAEGGGSQQATGGD